MSRVIYVAGPFRAPTHWGIVQNVRRAEEASLRLWEEGWAVITPHMNTANFQGACSDEVWIRGTLEILKRCDAIYMLRGWGESEGSKEELKCAREHGLEVYFEG